ncbi:hypothetical protein A0H81_10719 [Grifola frondosa]|uniref:Uncharacterized protein n=1 Tax=Grifola frondosa TaxID=5627 RepID=A0A1C7LX24_GRIFR|nr:hypothetical protein A0H81_10719 [Grifola frondosa]
MASSLWSSPNRTTPLASSSVLSHNSKLSANLGSGWGGKKPVSGSTSKALPLNDPGRTATPPTALLYVMKKQGISELASPRSSTIGVLALPALKLPQMRSRRRNNSTLPLMPISMSFLITPSLDRLHGKSGCISVKSFRH